MAPKEFKGTYKHNSRHQIGAKEFKEINWLTTKERVKNASLQIFFNIGRGTHHSMCMNSLSPPEL